MTHNLNAVCRKVNIPFIAHMHEQINNVFMQDVYTRIEQILKENRMNWADFARTIGASEQRVQNWKHRGVPPMMHRIIAEKINVNLEWLVTGTGTPKRTMYVKEQDAEYGPIVGNYRTAPIVGTAQLGDEGYWFENEYPVGHGEGYVDVPTKDPNAYSLRVRGQSMAPAIRDGWLVVCEPNKEPVVSEYVMVKTKDGRSMVKELLYSKAEGVTLLSVNDAFGRISLTWDKIDKIHAVSFIVPPSKIRL